jgi:hypothetical protein
MKTLLTLLLATLCAATGYGQTLKSVMIDTNGVQVNQFGSGSASNTAIKLGGTNWGFWQATGPDRILLSIGGVTGATFTANSITTTTFSGNLSGGVTIGAGQSISFGGGANVSGTRTNLNLGATWLTNTNVTNFRTAIGLGASNEVTFEAILGNSGGSINMLLREFMGDWIFSDSVSFGAPDVVRTNISLGLPALTNTSNVTAMRALAGSTNTNEPYSGIIQYADGPDGDIYEMTVSNGIILKIEMQ